MINPKTIYQLEQENDDLDEVLDQIEAEEKQKHIQNRITKYLKSIGFND